MVIVAHQILNITYRNYNDTDRKSKERDVTLLPTASKKSIKSGNKVLRNITFPLMQPPHTVHALQQVIL